MKSPRHIKSIEQKYCGPGQLAKVVRAQKASIVDYGFKLCHELQALLKWEFATAAFIDPLPEHQSVCLGLDSFDEHLRIGVRVDQACQLMRPMCRDRPLLSRHLILPQVDDGKRHWKQIALTCWRRSLIRRSRSEDRNYPHHRCPQQYVIPLGHGNAPTLSNAQDRATFPPQLCNGEAFCAIEVIHPV